MTPTHVLGGATCWLLVAAATHPDPKAAAAGAAVAGAAAVFPDLDRAIPALHRTLTHSLLGVTGWVLAWHWLATHDPRMPAWLPAAAIAGWCSHLVLDMLTKHGCPLLWPVKRPFHLLPKDLRISTGGRRRTTRSGKQVRRGISVEYWLVRPGLLSVGLLAAFVAVHP